MKQDMKLFYSEKDDLIRFHLSEGNTFQRVLMTSVVNEHHMRMTYSVHGLLSVLQ